jgi:hypothetical protein
MAHSEDSNTPHETQPDDAGDMVIEGLRPPLTREQRRRRIAMSALVVAGALAVLLWPAISAFQIALPSLPYVARATATPNHSPRWSGGIAVTTLEISNVSVCQITPEQTSSIGLPEMQADAAGGEVWALLLSGPTIRANHPTNIVWRATGSGAFQVVALGADIGKLAPASGPDPHGSSNWRRPGDEWGTTFVFPQPGCWQLLVTRGASLTATLSLMVAP